MAGRVLLKHNGDNSPARASARTSPDLLIPSFGRMGTMFRQVENEMNNMLHMFDMPATISGSARPDWRLAVDIKEDDKQFVLSADVPGMDKGDVKITVSPDNMLSISGERKIETEKKEGDHVQYVERSYGKFLRRFRLPDNVDVEHIGAKQEHGVLTLTVPKVEKKDEGAREILIA